MWGKKDWNSKQPKRSPGMQSHGVMQLGGWPGCLLSPALPFGWHPSDLGREDRHLPTFCQGGVLAGLRARRESLMVENSFYLGCWQALGLEKGKLLECLSGHSGMSRARERGPTRMQYGVNSLEDHLAVSEGIRNVHNP